MGFFGASHGALVVQVAQEDQGLFEAQHPEILGRGAFFEETKLGEGEGVGDPGRSLGVKDGAAAEGDAHRLLGAGG